MKALETDAIVTSFRSRADGSLGLTLVTPELTVEEKAEFMRFQNVNARLLLKPMTDGEADGIMEVKKELDHKTPSQRLRSSLFVWFKQASQKQELTYGTLFEEFYNQQMETIILRVKENLDE